VDKAIKKLPIAKVMRWGSGDAQFVRPVHGLVMLHGNRVVPGKVLGLESKASTLGHRFMSSGPIDLKSAAEYEAKLLDPGMVVGRITERTTRIENQLREKATQLEASLGPAEDTGPLVDEVAALVEYPTVYVGKFDAAYLEVPQECLILTMRQNQKYFPLFDAAGKLLPRFLVVSNMKVTDARHIVGGNERVVRPRLEDARFFYEQDRKQRLEERVPLLSKVVYHNRLGSQLDRVQRIQLLAGSIARRLKTDAASAERAAWLSKADLLTGMVGEFPELQGLMGRYYAIHDGEPAAVAHAIEAHYRATRAIAFRRIRSRAPWRLPTSSIPWPACSASESSPPARRIPSAFVAPHWEWFGFSSSIGLTSRCRTSSTMHSADSPAPSARRTRTCRYSY
jgi:glycyl-tRNA synthetase beta chain